MGNKKAPPSERSEKKWNDPWLHESCHRSIFFVVKGHFCSLLISNIIGYLSFVRLTVYPHSLRSTHLIHNSLSLSAGRSYKSGTNSMGGLPCFRLRNLHPFSLRFCFFPSGFARFGIFWDLLCAVTETIASVLHNSKLKSSCFFAFLPFFRLGFRLYLSLLLTFFYTALKLLWGEGLEPFGFTCTLVSPLCIYKISQEFWFCNTEYCTNWWKFGCAKHRFPRERGKSRLTSGGRICYDKSVGRLKRAAQLLYDLFCSR